MPPRTHPTPIQRPLTVLDRRSLLKALSLAAGAPLALTSALRAEAQEAGLIGSDVCLLLPEVTEGPYYLDLDLVRSDTAEGKPGLPLALRLQVVTAACEPIEGARVDLWHCDAGGSYSGVSGNEQNFLRGTQFTDAAGVVAFQTIFPGWYSGRVTHIHYTIYLSENRVMTGQVFFDEALTTVIHGEHPAYEGHGQQDTPLARDGIARQAGAGAIAQLELDAPDGDAVATMVVGIDPEHRSGSLLERLFGRG